MEQTDIKGNFTELIEMCMQDIIKHSKRLRNPAYYSDEKRVEGMKYDRELIEANKIYIKELQEITPVKSSYVSTCPDGKQGKTNI